MGLRVCSFDLLFVLATALFVQPGNALTGYNASATLADRLRGATINYISLCEDNAVHHLCGPELELGGATAEIAAILFERAGVTAIPLSAGPNPSFPTAANRAKYGSTWTACVADVSDGTVDMCLGSFWETGQRREISSFVSPYDTEQFQLWVRTGTPKPDLFAAAFLPFTSELWAYIAALIVFHGAMVALLGVLHKVARKRYKTAKKIQKGLPEKPEKHADLKKRGFGRHVRHVGGTLFDSSLGFLSGGVVADGASNLPTKLVCIAYGLFILVVVASYTANLAAFLTVQAQSSSYEDINDAISKAARLCVGSGVLDSYLSIYPTGKFEGFDEISKEWGQLDEGGKCDGIVEDRKTIFAYQAKGEFCEVGSVGNVVLQVPLAMPVMEQAAGTLSYHMAAMRSDGTIAQILENNKQEPACAGGDDSAKLAIDNMASVFLIYAISAGLAILLGIALFAKDYIKTQPILRGAKVATEHPPGDKSTDKATKKTANDTEIMEMLCVMHGELKLLREEVNAIRPLPLNMHAPKLETTAIAKQANEKAWAALTENLALDGSDPKLPLVFSDQQPGSPAATARLVCI